MKTILLIAGMLGFLSTASFAQATNCTQTHVLGTCPGDRLHTTFVLAPASDQKECVTYKNGNTVVTACPGTADNFGNIGYNIEGTYNGNYPLACTSHELSDGSVIVNCRPRCVLMDDPLTGRQWFDCPGGR